MKKASIGLTVLALTTTAVVLQGSTASGSIAETCSQSFLAPLAGTYSSIAVTATDPSGRYQVAQTLTSLDRLEVAIWHNGAGSILIKPALGYIEPLDVNVRAEVVGYAYTSFSPIRGWRFRDGERITLHPPAGLGSSTAVAINAAGEVAGYAENASSARAIAWTAGNVVRLLPLPDGFTAAQATDIDDDGVVVGFASAEDEQGMTSKRQPVVWPVAGGYRLLPTSDANGWASVEAVRNGIAVGDDNGTAVSWNLTNDARTVLSTEPARATDVNAGGDVAVVKQDGSAEFLRRNQPPRPAGDINVQGLSDSARVYNQDRSVYDCG